MKHFLTLFLLFHFLIAFTQGDLFIYWDQEDIICKETERADKLIQLGSSRNEFAHQTDMHYQLMKWEIFPANYYIKGEITYHFKSLVPNLTELILDLTDDLQINSILRGTTPLTYTHGTDQLLRIQLGKTLNPGEYDSLTINYEGTPPSNGFGSFEQGTHAGSSIIWTLSEPYGCRDWWPSKQDLIDKVDSVDIYITTPPGNLAASNGKLMSISETDGKLVHHWRHRYPIVAYLIALAVTDYAAYSQYVPLPNGDSIEVLNYVYPETLQESITATAASIDIMKFYNEVFGIYPFAAEKYGHAQFGWGGGEEHQTMSFMGGFSFSLQAHEMAHQWFGDKVTCGSWTDIWLNEGFATYMTGLTYERFSPTEFWPAWKNSTSNNATSQPGGSVWVDDTTNVGRIFSGRLSYNKAAYLLHMARWVTGDSAFYQACRNYLDIPGTAYDFGRTAELKGYLENASGKDFDEFLSDWFYGQGFPSYELTFQDWPDNDSLILIVHQIQSHPSVSFFEMPIPILVVLDGVENIFRVENTHQDQRFAFFIGGAYVDSVGFDPDKWILSRNNSVDFIIVDAVYDPNDDSFMIHPNPANDWIEFEGNDEIYSVDMINPIGVSNHLKVINNRVDLSGFSAGVYTLILKDRLNKVLSLKRVAIQK